MEGVQTNIATPEAPVEASPPIAEPTPDTPTAGEQTQSAEPATTAAESAAEQPATQEDNAYKAMLEEASKKFSKEELESFINMGSVMASKAVLTVLSETIKERVSQGASAEDNKRGRTLAKRVRNARPYQHSGYISLDFDDPEIKLTLCVSLARVSKEYELQVDIPSEQHGRNLFIKFAFLKNLAMAYWAKFTEDNPKLLRKVAKYMPDIDFSQLQVDKQKPYTMYFNPASESRIGIYCFFLDEHGKPFYRKGQK